MIGRPNSTRQGQRGRGVFQSKITNQKSKIPLRRGFTLIEAALTLVIVSTGVLSILAAQQAYHRKNDWAQRTGTAMLLANELRELTLTLPMYDPMNGRANPGPTESEQSVADLNDLADFAGPVGPDGTRKGWTFSPPINALRQPIADMAGWSQEIRVDNVLPDYISASYTPGLGSTDLMRVSVTVRYQKPSENEAMTMTTLSWVVGK